MLNIVFVGPAYPYRGGIASFNHQLARNFKASGDKCRIETFTLQYPSLLFPGKSQYSDEAPITDIDISRSVNSINPISWIKVGVKLRDEAPDIIFLRYWTPYLAPALATIARIASCNGKSKIIALVDNIIAHEAHIYDKPLTNYFVRSIDGFVVMSKEVGNDMCGFDIGAKRIVRTPHPLYDNYGTKQPREESAKMLGLDPSYSYALFFGLIRDYKGLDLMLDGWAKFLKQIPGSEKYRLIIAGEFYSGRERHLNSIDVLGIKDSIILHDHFIEDELIKYYFSLSDVVVQPYRNATQSGITQIAYNFDLPMIVTNVGGLAEIVEDGETGLITEVSSDSVSEALLRFYREGMKERISVNVSKARSRYSWDAMRETITKLYHKMVEYDD